MSAKKNLNMKKKKVLMYKRKIYLKMHASKKCGSQSNTSQWALE